LNKIATMIQILLRDEALVSAAMTQMSERHRDDHEVFHLTRELATWSDEHVTMIAEVARRYGAARTGDPDIDAGAMLDRVRDELADRSEPEVDRGVLLLRQLRALHLACVGLSVDWEVLAQTAKAVRDDELLALAERCQSDAARQMKWANAKIKEAAPQVMATR